MDYNILLSDINLLRDQGMNDEDLAHSVLVAEKALDLARRTGAELDMELVGRGGLFHDLGKTVSGKLDHGVLGAEKGAELGLPAEVNAIMEKHIRGGLTPPEAENFGLPVKDYTMNRLEERIVAYADRLVDIIHEDLVEIIDELEAETHFKDILMSNEKYGNNEITTARYLSYHDEIQHLIAGA